MANDKYNKTFLQSETLEDAKEQLREVYEANPDAVIIVEEEGKECLIEHGKQLNFVPSGGKKGQVLTADEEGSPVWGDDLETLSQDLGDKEDKVVIETASGTSLSAKVNRYYRFSSAVNSLTVTLPTIPSETNPRIKSLVLSFTTGSSPSVKINAPVSVDYLSGYSIEANKTYELNCLYNGLKWVVAYGIVE